MKKILLLLATFAYTTVLFGQLPNIKFGKVPLADVQMTIYPLDSSAEAVILYDHADIFFTMQDSPSGYYFKMTKDYHIRLKILKKSGLSQATREITFVKRGSMDKTEAILNIEGSTFNIENGSLIEDKLDKKMIFEEKIMNDYYRKKITFPNVKEGSVIEFKYRVETPFGVSIQPDTWYFQGNTPIAWSDYQIVIPSHFYYKITMGGYLPLFLNDQKEVNVDMGHTRYNTNGISYHFIVKDAPAFRNEPFITTPFDYLSKIDFELANYRLPTGEARDFVMDWENVDRTLLGYESFGGQLRKESVVKDELVAVQSGGATDEKAKAIYNYVKNTYKWDENERFYSADGIKKAVTNKKGNSADINFVLLNLLAEVGYTVSPVILSTRTHGRISEQFPLIDRFNYTIVALEKEDNIVLLDATDPNIPFGILPRRCLNGIGRLVKKGGGSKFIPLNAQAKYVLIEEVNARVNADLGGIEGTYMMKLTGYAAYDFQEINKNKDEKKIAAEIQSKNSEWELSEFKFENKLDPDLASAISYQFVPADVTPNPGMIYIEPMLGAKISENPFKANERIYPVDFGWTTTQSYLGKITIPTNYVIESKPADLVLLLPKKGGRFIYSVKYDDVENALIISSALSLAKTIYTAEDYHYLKEFYDRIVQKHTEQIVLKIKE